MTLKSNILRTKRKSEINVEISTIDYILSKESQNFIQKVIKNKKVCIVKLLHHELLKSLHLVVFRNR